MDQPTSEVVKMDEPKSADWLTRETIDRVIEGMSAGDLVTAMGKFPDSGSTVEMPIYAFDLAAARMGVSNGSPASAHIRMSDLKYLGGAIGEAVNVDSPLSSGQED